MSTNENAIRNTKQKRARLHDAMCDLEASVSSPSQVPTWISDLAKRLHSVQGALLDHIAEVEGPDGIIAGILEDAPRLSADAEILLADHPVLRERTERVVERVQSAGAAPDAAATQRIRRSVLKLLGLLSSHRHLGADFVYEAYHFDIGGQA